MSSRQTQQSVKLIFSAMWVFLVQPLWLAVMFGILSLLTAPTWMWVCYWVYVVSTVLLALTQALTDVLKES